MNKVVLMGRLTKDVEKRFTKNQKELYCFTLAVPRKMDKEKVDFIDCIAFAKLGEVISKYTSKGTKIIVNGELNINQYEDKDGNKRSSTTVIVNDFYFTENKKVEEPKQEDTNDLPF